MDFLVKLLLNGLAVILASYLTPGVRVDSFVTAIIVSLLLGLLNTFLKPILILLTLPINILTLGLFILVINTFIILLGGKIVPGFKIGGFGSAFIFGIVLTLVNWFLSSLT